MLTEHQQQKLDELVGLIAKGHKRVVLQGSAGTGKTFLVNSLITELKKRLYTYGATWCTAPTHKALEVLRGKIDTKSYLEFATIHSALCLEMKYGHNGKKFFSPRVGSIPLRNATVCIVDEASMVDSGLIKIMDEHCSDKLVVFIGDSRQLNPIGEYKSPIFHQGYPIVELTEIIRQGEGNPIIELSNNLHWLNHRQDNYKLEMLPWLDEETPKGYLFTDERNRIIDRLAEVNGSDEIKYMAYHNDDVNAMNYDVRRKIYKNPGKVELGESLIFMGPYGTYFNNQEIKVEELNIQPIKLEVPTAKSIEETLTLQSYFVNGDIAVLHPDSEAIFKKACVHAKAEAINRQISWSTYYKFEESFASITYNHALTVHKSQGSTYKKGIMHLYDIQTNRSSEERQRMLYTAITRASDLVIIFN